MERELKRGGIDFTARVVKTRGDYGSNEIATGTEKAIRKQAGI